MKKIIILSFALWSVCWGYSQDYVESNNDWTVSGLEGPESVVYDKSQDVLYVSNVNGNPKDKDGNGYISKISTSGLVIDQKWVEGLNGPKGLAIHKGKLYAADIDQIVVIDIKSGKVESKYAAPEATFLNDVAIDNKGNVYVSNTFGFSAIYKLSKGNVETWIKGDSLDMPNGLYVQGNSLFVVGWGKGLNPKTYETETAGKLSQINIKTKEIMPISNLLGNLDGLEATSDGFLITDWLAGKMFHYSNKDKNSVEVMTLKKGAADIHFMPKTKTVYVPQMLDGILVCYKFK